MRPPDLSADVESYKHGTRGRYVAGCRCGSCRASNTAYYHERQARARALLEERVAELDEPAPAEPIAKVDSRGRRVYKRACPGLELEQGCPWVSYLRSDSKGGICGRCRGELAADPLVDAGRARAKIRRLRRKGIGRRSIADAAGVARSAVAEISAGRKLQIRLSTERRLLKVDAGAAAGATVVDARPTWKLINELLEEGFTKGAIAQRALGVVVPALQLRKDRVLASSALRVAKFYRMIMAGG
jgi:transcriptional regulator with XRE-family HTH domain